MLQRQIMFKQLQELQRRQQFQELDDTRNQSYVNRLSSLNDATGAIGGALVQGSSQMHVFDNMNMPQLGESNGLSLSQIDNLALGPLGLSQQNLDMSVLGTHIPNTDNNLNQYSQLQGPSKFLVHPMPNNSYSLGMSTVQPSAYENLFTNIRFSSDQVNMSDGALLSNQEKTLFAQVPMEGSDSGILSRNYSQQGVPVTKNAALQESEGEYQTGCWDGHSPGKTSKLGLSHNSATSLDPLEQKILYSTDENIWESFSVSSRASTGGLDGIVDHTSDTDAFPSLQSGSWSALMQSAVAENSSTDTKMQEEWSGLSFQKPEPLNDDQPSNFMNNENQQIKWVDRNLQNASSASSSETGHSIQNFKVKCNFPSSLQPSLQPFKQKEEYQSEAGHATAQHSPRIVSQLAGFNNNRLPSNFLGPESGGASWFQVSSSFHACGTQKPYDQSNCNATSPSDHNVNNYINIKHPAPPLPDHMVTEQPPNLASKSFITSPNEQPDHISFQHEFEQQLGTCSENSEHNAPQLEKGSLGRSLFPTRDTEAFNSVNQCDSLLHQTHTSRNTETHGNENGSREAEGDVSGKTSPMAYNKNFQQTGLLGQNYPANHSVDSNDASNTTYQSQISLQMAPSWFKHYGTLKNEQMGPMTGENTATMHLNMASSDHGSSLWTCTAATSINCKQPNFPNALLPNATYQKLDASVSKKRKHVALDMIPWHKEVNREPSRLLNMSEAELVWVFALNRRAQEVADEAEISEEISMLIRAKRRLICTTQLMQQVFPPAPAVILCSDASSSCDSIAYYSSRVTLGDVCRLTVNQSPSNTNELSPSKLKTTKRTNACKFSNVVEGLEDRVKKLKDNLLRLEKSLSLLEIKVETQELEKFSILNRFAKFHTRSHSSSVNPAPHTEASKSHKTNPQRYVLAVPMPTILPEGVDCLSL